MTQYSNYIETNTMTPVMYLRVNTIVIGEYIDYSGNGYNATVVTITDANDGLTLADDNDLRDFIRNIGLYDLFYDSLDTPKEVLKAHIGRIYNNILFNNDDYIMLYSEPLVGTSLTATMNLFFGAIDSDASDIINTIGVTSELEQRLIDTHVKDLKELNETQAGLFAFGDIGSSIIKELHPMVGTTFTNMKYNWIEPSDTDASYRLALINGSATRVFNNAINFDGTFALGTYLNASTVLDSTNSFSYYSPFDLSDESDTRVEMGCVGVAGSYSGVALKIQRDVASHSICEDTYQNPTKGVQYAETNSSAYYLVNKSANDDLKAYRNRIQIGATVTTAGASSYYNGNIILGGYSVDGTIDEDKLSILPCGYYHIGGKIDAGVLQGFIDAVIRLCSSKNLYYFPPDETARV